MIRGTRHLRIKNGDVLLMVGTTKGAFLLRSTNQRSRWDVAGPYFHGHAVYAMAYDGRDGRHRLWASTHNFWGTFLRSSDDFGRTWTNPLEANLKFPADCGSSLNNIWQISLSGHDGELMYCGVEPAALFESRNSGETWSLVRGLFEHPHRPRWMPGNGGLALHTILQDPVNPQRIRPPCVPLPVNASELRSEAPQPPSVTPSRLCGHFALAFATVSPPRKERSESTSMCLSGERTSGIQADWRLLYQLELRSRSDAAFRVVRGQVDGNLGRQWRLTSFLQSSGKVT